MWRRLELESRELQVLLEALLRSLLVWYALESVSTERYQLIQSSLVTSDVTRSAHVLLTLYMRNLQNCSNMWNILKD